MRFKMSAARQDESALRCHVSRETSRREISIRDEDDEDDVRREETTTRNVVSCHPVFNNFHPRAVAGASRVLSLPRPVRCEM